MPEKLPGVVSRQVAHDHPADDVAGLYAGLSDPVRRRLLREHSKVDVRLVLLELGKQVSSACLRRTSTVGTHLQVELTAIALLDALACPARRQNIRMYTC